MENKPKQRDEDRISIESLIEQRIKNGEKINLTDITDEELEESKVEELVSYKRKVVLFTALISSLLIIVIVGLWIGVDLFMEYAFRKSIEKMVSTGVEERMSEYESVVLEYLQSGEDDETIRNNIWKVVKGYRRKNIELKEDEYDYINFMMKVLVFSSVILAVFIASFYIRNNFDISLFTGGVRTKEIQAKGILENIRITQLDAKRRIIRRRKKENRREKNQEAREKRKQEEHDIKMQKLKQGLK